jgi:hypothetical protein
MGMLYPWASPHHLLENYSLQQIFYYYDYAISYYSGKPPRAFNDKPDIAGFYKHYGDKIKRPGGGR